MYLHDDRQDYDRDTCDCCGFTHSAGCSFYQPPTPRPDPQEEGATPVKCLGCGKVVPFGEVMRTGACRGCRSEWGPAVDLRSLGFLAVALAIVVGCDAGGAQVAGLATAGPPAGHQDADVALQGADVAEAHNPEASGQDSSPGADSAPATPDAAGQPDAGPQDAGQPDAVALPPDCSDTCMALGLCTVQGSGCAATTDAQCLASWACAKLGRCTAKGGKCAVGDDYGCHLTAGCTELGLCTWHPAKQICVAMWDDDCANAQVCKQSGKCWPSYGVCK